MSDSTSRTVRPKNTTAFSRTHTVCMLLLFGFASYCATYQPDLRDDGGLGQEWFEGVACVVVVHGLRRCDPKIAPRGEHEVHYEHTFEKSQPKYR
jgi:hypothetical protein